MSFQFALPNRRLEPARHLSPIRVFPHVHVRLRSHLAELITTDSVADEAAIRPCLGVDSSTGLA